MVGSITMSAPNSAARFRRDSIGSDMMTVRAPLNFANAAVIRPITPPPITRTTASSGISNISRPDRQHAEGSIIAAVCRSSPAGTSRALYSGMTAYSAMPNARNGSTQTFLSPALQPAQSPHTHVGMATTRRPRIDSSTPGPVSTITP